MNGPRARPRGLFILQKSKLKLLEERGKNLNYLKNGICTAFGVTGAWIAALFGGWDSALVTLLILMLIDYVSGLIVAGVFHTSQKSDSGTLESKASWKGLCRKGMTLLFVLIGYRLDLAVGSNYIKNAICIGFVVNEALSITENAGLMGMPLPGIVKGAINILKQKADEEDISK